MRRSDRLLEILQILRDGNRHRAEDIAARLGVSVRTIYRDMDTLQASGLSVEGARGQGYKIGDTISLPPLTLTEAELEALNLGIAIVSEAADPALKTAAQHLAEKIDAGLSVETVAEADAWKFAIYPFADAARGLSHMAPLRAAITGRQKLRICYRRPDGTRSTRQIRPLMMEYWGRGWILTAWCEWRSDFRMFRLDLIEEATALPELFVDEPGRTLSDFRSRT